MSSTEQSYVYEKAHANGRTDIAADVLRVSTGGQAKALSHRIYTSTEWENVNEKEMKEILMEKAIQIPEVGDILMNSGTKLIAEAVQSEEKWTCGLSKKAATHTSPSHWPGQNRLGHLWMEIREELKEQDDDGFTKYESKKRKASSNHHDTPVAQRPKPSNSPP